MITTRTWIVALCLLAGATGFRFVSANARARTSDEAHGNLLVLQMVPAEMFSIAGDAVAKLTKNEIERIELRYRQLRVTGTIILAADATVDCGTGDGWRAVFVVTRRLDDGEAPSLQLPSEPSLLYLQGRPDEPTDKGWIVTSPEDHQYPRSDPENHRRVNFQMSGVGDNEMRYVVLDGEREISKEVACRWP